MFFGGGATKISPLTGLTQEIFPRAFCSLIVEYRDGMCLRKQQVLWPGVTVLGALILVGCASSKVAPRRQAYANEYTALSAEEKATVDRGALSEGMSTNAVLIAWGEPTTISTISTPNGPFVIWEYYRKKTITEQPVQRELIIPRSSTPVPESRVFPNAGVSHSTRVIESLDRTAVFHDERLVNWSPRKSLPTVAGSTPDGGSH
jgi:hypothetical protein